MEQNAQTHSSAFMNLSLREYNGVRVIDLSWQGRKCWLAPNLEQVFGYSKRGISNLIGQEWKEEFEIGKHYDVLRGGELRVLKKSLKSLVGSHQISPNCRQIMIIYEQGLDLILLKTDKDPGRIIRSFLVDHIIPPLRETGSVSLPGSSVSHEETLLRSFVDSLINRISTLSSSNSLDDNAIEGIADALARRLASPQQDIHVAAQPTEILSARFRVKTIQSKIKKLVTLCLQINPRFAKSSYSTLLYNWLRTVASFGVSGCHWGRASLETFTKAENALDAQISLFERLTSQSEEDWKAKKQAEQAQTEPLFSHDPRRQDRRSTEKPS